MFHASGNHYVWSKVTSTVHNIIVGKLWIDQVRCSFNRQNHNMFCEGKGKLSELEAFI